MTIGERIGALRRAAGLSQERLAEQLGVSRQAIGKWEAGASLPGVDNLQELARALGVSCDELITGCPPVEKAADGSGPGTEGTVALESVRALLDEQAGTQRRAGRLHQWLAAALAGLACVAAGACVFIAVYTSGRLNYFSGKLGGLEAAVAGIDGTIDARVAALEGSLQQQASLVASFDFRYGSPGWNNASVPLSVSVLPKNYQPGMSAVFTLSPSGGEAVVVEALSDGGNGFCGELAIPLENEYSNFTLSVGFTGPDGIVQSEELLRESDFVLGYRTVVAVSPKEFTLSHSTRTPESERFWRVGGEFELNIQRGYQDTSPYPVAAEADLVVGGKVVQTVSIDVSLFSDFDTQASQDGAAQFMSGASLYESFETDSYEISGPEEVEIVARVTESTGNVITASHHF